MILLKHPLALGGSMPTLQTRPILPCASDVRREVNRDTSFTDLPWFFFRITFDLPNVSGSQVEATASAQPPLRGGIAYFSPSYGVPRE